MPGFVARRLLSALPTLFLIITVSFFLIRLAPGGPFDLERPLEAKVMENLQKLYRLDLPLWQQYLHYLGGLARGDLGPSFYMRDFSVAELIAKGLPVSATIGGLALLLAIGLGVPMGLLAAFRQNTFADYIVTGAAAVGITIPNFVKAPVFQIVFGLWLAWLPVAGWNDGAARNLVLPVLTLGLAQVSIIARLMRAAAIEVLQSNHIRTLRAAGLPPLLIARSALRAAALPVVSYLGPAAASLLAGSLVVENIFSLPGVGRYFIEGALNRDYTMVMGTVVLISIFVLLFNVMVDVLYAVLDPRVRAGT